MKAIVIGAGGTTRELLRRLGELWEIVVIDPDEHRLELAKGIRSFTPIVGDGSSRVVLEKAGFRQADAVVVATNDDYVNYEVIRLAQEADILRIVAIAADPERLVRYRESGVPTFSPDRLAARQLEIHLEPRRVSSAAFADGRAEAIEFRIAADAPVVGRSLIELGSETWLVAAILRQGKLIVPHGGTVIEQGDVITVVGAATDYSTIVRTFTSGESRFPTDYGKRVAVALDSERDLIGPIAEAIYFTRLTPASSLVVVHRDLSTVKDEGRKADIEVLIERVEHMAEGIELHLRGVAGSPSKEILNVPQGESIGVIVAALSSPGSILGRWRISRFQRELRECRIPILLSRGSFPYESVVVPARDTAAGRAAAHAAIDMASYSDAPLTGIAAYPPPFLSGPDVKDEARRAAARVREEAAIRNIEATDHQEQGNPIRILVTAAGADRSLLVLGASLEGSAADIAGGVIRRTTSSVLLVPTRETQ